MEKRKNPLATEFWTTLSTDELSKRLHELGPDDIVFTPEYYCVSSGQTLPPTDSVRMLVSSSSAPIYTIFSGQLGSGVVGGSMNTLADMGRATRALIDEILEGQVTDHNEVRAPTAMVQLDWRQLHQWNIPEARIPPNAIVHFRPPSLLELYRSQPIVGAFICIAQGALIVALLFERRRRQKTAKALAQSQKQATDVARAARLTFFEWNFDSAAPVGPSRKPSCAPNFTKNEFERVIDEVHPSDREHLRSAVQHAIDRGEELNLEYRTLGPDGRPSWVSVRGHAAPNGQARIAGFCMDINDRKLEQLQSAQDRAALTQMARVSTMGQLSAAIAHQLNQPLMAILCNAETARKMLGRNEPSLEELKRILSDIVEENVRAGDIIRNLTALYRNGVTDRTAFDLNELVLETAELLRAELTARNVVTRVELAPELPAFDGSRIQIQQVLFNLMLNAADAMAETKIGHRLLILRSAMKNESLQICVIDHGDGITPTALERIFQPFWTTKPQGVGVGLTISRTIVEAHGGSLCASNRLEGGAQFCLSLPAQTAT